MKTATRTPCMVESLENRQLMTAVNFTIDSTLSAIKLTAGYAVPALGFSANMTAQKTGTDTSKYSGTIKTDITAGKIKFLAGSVYDAIGSTSLVQPGNAVADYAMTVAVPFVGSLATAIRTFKFDTSTTAALPISSTGTFAGTAINGKITAGTVAYALTGSSAATTSLVGKSSANNITTTCKIVQSGKVLTLTIPVSYTITYSSTVSGFTGTGTLKVTGTVTAKATLATAGTSTISGSVYKDNDKSGTKTPGDTAFSAVRVYLDLNNNGKYDTTDKSVLTAADGSFTFTGIAPGAYKVYEVVPTGYTKSQPTTAFFGVNTITGQAVTGLLFGNKK